MLVNQHHLTFLNNVFHVTLKQYVSAQARVHVVQQPKVGRSVEGVIALQQSRLDQHALDLLVTALRQFNAALLLIDREVTLLLFDLKRELGNQSINGLVELRAVVYRTRDNERRTRLVDQNRIDLVNNRERQFALALVGHAEGHIVAQIVKTKLIVGAVHHVAAIGRSLFFGTLPGPHYAHGQTQKLV